MEMVMFLSLLCAFWLGAEHFGFPALCRGLSERLEELQTQRERYDGVHDE